MGKRRHAKGPNPLSCKKKAVENSENPEIPEHFFSRFIDEKFFTNSIFII